MTTPDRTCRRSLALTLALAIGTLAWEVSVADDPATVEVTIRDHRFSPSEIRVPAGTALVLTVKNQDATAEEFDSGALKVEKVIAGNRSAAVHVRPLAKGRYPFVGEYHEDTARGVVIAE